MTGVLALAWLVTTLQGVAAAASVSPPPGIACSQSEPAFDIWVTAHEAFRARHYTEAARCFTLATPAAEHARQLAVRYGAFQQSSPSVYEEMASDSRVFLGLSYWHNRQLLEATSAWRKSIAQREPKAITVPSRGTRLWLERRYPSAVSALEPYLSNEINSLIRADIKRAFSQARAGNWVSVRDLLHDAARIDPSNKAINFLLGLFGLRQNDIADAQCQWLRALDLSDFAPEALNQNGDLEGYDSTWLLIESGRRVGILCR